MTRKCTWYLVLLFVAAFCLIEPWGVIGQSRGTDLERKPVGVEDILELKKAGVGDDLIIETIQKTNTTLELTVNEIIELKRKGLSDAIIRALLAPKGADKQVEPPRTPIPTVIPVYTPTPTINPGSDTSEQNTAGPEATPEAGAGEQAVESLADPTATIDSRPDRSIFKISSEPSKAKVYLDERYVGVTPYYTNIGLGGKHVLVLRKEFYRDLKVEIDLEDESIDDLHLEMRLEQPLVSIKWLTIENEYVSAFKWSARNCDIAGSEEMIHLEPVQLNQEFEERYLVQLPDLKRMSPGDLACLEFFVWFKSTWSKKELYGLTPRPDIHFLITDIPLVYDEPVVINLALQHHNRYPQGTRIILDSKWGKLFRMDPRNTAERKK
ncbi:PEGA domain-containing protein [bacterium]|nr:PEGA domain-containing protein [bacterium]